ncbi:MAG: UDP-N-acetylmuramoyl-L-alanyl-D-glutamate--2,6-diaminopimelate ligase [Kangiellaceae bacterium]|nr:UDP-N-acetylmuramoyl-L-alanyl-D-glutamate--2,6-diaminopimelate ligase [Kangiellaceae bacterium]
MANSLILNELENLFDSVELFCGNPTVDVKQLTIDSRLVAEGDCFIATVGHVQDGRRFINDAIDRGAHAIICEADSLDSTLLDSCKSKNISCFLISELGPKLSAIADYFYQSPSKRLFSVGITGTNGKSSSVQMLSQALHLIDGCCWTLGTLGCGPYGAQKANDNTTADAITVQREFSQAANYGCANAVMEVSSHGLVQGRVSQVDYNVAVFTNLSRDHLDYHKTMEAYGEAKKMLFLMPSLQWAVINVDDKFGRKLKKDDSIKGKKLFLSLREPSDGADLNQWIWAEDIRLTLSGIKANIYTPWGKGELNVPLIGRFNLYNLLSVIAVLGIKLNDADAVFEAVNQLKSVKGRMQLIKYDDQPLVIVDYAHSPDALEQVLKATREHCSGKIITVFGCGGDRDPGKRPLMGRVAEKYSNQCIITDDNPRTEDPSAIVEGIKNGFKHSPGKYLSNRFDAIASAIKSSSSSDVVLIAGKGHEDYQIIGSDKVYFSDEDVAHKVLMGRVA